MRELPTMLIEIKGHAREGELGAVELSRSSAVGKGEFSVVTQ